MPTLTIEGFFDWLQQNNARHEGPFVISGDHFRAFFIAGEGRWMGIKGMRMGGRALRFLLCLWG